MTTKFCDERDVVLRFQKAATPEELAATIRDPTPDEERALRIYLSNDRFQRLNALAYSLSNTRGAKLAEGNVAVLPGIMGSDISVNDATQNRTLVWFSLLHVIGGWLPHIGLAEDGESPSGAYVGTATNIMNRYYGDMVLQLSKRWKARAFWYDWRKSLRRAASDLEHFLRREFLDQEVTLVAHSMGGLVARTLMADESPPKAANGKPLIKRLVMLGTPNLGSFEVPLMFSGIQDSVRRIIKITGGLSGLFNPVASRRAVLELLNSFPGIYQMMPWPEVATDANSKAEIERLYDPSTYATFNPSVSAHYLQSACDHQKVLKNIKGSHDMVYVAGYGEPTVVGLETADDLTDPDNYILSTDGDGRVPHVCGLLPGVATFYVACAHGELARSPDVLSAIDELIASGSTSKLPNKKAEDRAVTTPGDVHRQWAKRFDDTAKNKEDEEIADLIRCLERSVGISRDTISGFVPPPMMSSQERELEELVAEPFLGGASARSESRAATDVPRIRVSLCASDIAVCHANLSGDPRDHALAVGVYTGVKPCGAVAVLDESISAAVRGEEGTRHRGKPLITQLIEGGTLRGELGSPFLLPDPRPGPDGKPTGFLIALAGLGVPGRCGIPELTVAVRELCWVLNSLGKKNLTSLLIGSGEGNLDIRSALLGFFNGVARAYSGTKDAATSSTPPNAQLVSGVPWHLKDITILEWYGDRLHSIAEELVELQKKFADEGKLIIDYSHTDTDLEFYRNLARDQQEEKLQRELERIRRSKGTSGASPAASSDTASTRVVFSMDEDVYRYSAITPDASIPERTVEVNSRLIDQANNLLVSAESLDEQRRAGLLLGQLIVPRDLRPLFQPQSPLVMAVDSRSARVHWEMLVMEDRQGEENLVPGEFLGMQRGFTRQLRTAFAPAPEPPPPARRTLRVLVVADPAHDARLRGALAEAAEVADLFEAFNHVYRSDVRTEVTRLIGPSNATQIKVMSELLLGKYDVLHYAGHCMFNTKDPPRSGWIFGMSPMMVLSSFELRRIDRVPRFVFSNACESGITPDRAENRHAELAPSFAEAFFDRGVANFVCTAWPVDDNAARMFARYLYAALLGLKVTNGSTLKVTGARSPLPLHQAMQEARFAAAKAKGGIRTWGAYQHYGNPYARFFAENIERHVRPKFSDTDDSVPPSAAPGQADGQPAAPGGPPAAPASVSTTGNVDDDLSVFDKQFEPERAAIAGEGQRLRSIPGVLDVRPGIKFTNGESTHQPAVVVVVRRKREPDLVPPGEMISPTIGGVPVDVAPATPAEQLQSADVRSIGAVIPAQEALWRPGDPMTLSEGVTERRLPYLPPEGVELNEIKDEMTVTCHVSPDSGWEVLDGFLQDVKKKLTLGIYDLSAPHVVKRLTDTLSKSRRKLRIVVDPGLTLTTGGDAKKNPKAQDITEDEVRERLEDSLGKRLNFVWAAVKRKGKVNEGIFPTSYHIKLAVRDSSAFWYSSGNMQSTNQPSEDSLQKMEVSWDEPRKVLTRFNREWHVVIEHEGLAKTMEAFLEHDFEIAEPLQAGDRGMLREPAPQLLIPPEYFEDDDTTRATKRARRFPKEVFAFSRDNPLRVQPLLTPDNYAEHVLRLIKKAENSLLFQNQYINLSPTPHPMFSKLINALKAKVNNPKIDVRIILRDLPDARNMLEALEAYGFDTDRILLQKSTHTKGIIIDDEIAVVGSHNWSSFGTTQNRDASMIFYDPQIAGYYRDIFEHDWNVLTKKQATSERAMPLVASSDRSLTGQLPDMVHVPWDAIFED